VSLGRGLFRAWIVISVLWVVGVMAFAISVVPGVLAGWKYQYVPVMRPELDPNKIDSNRPFYDVMKSPSQEGLRPTFEEVTYHAFHDKRVGEGSMATDSFPDGSVLYLPSGMTNEDKKYLAQQFWRQRWLRWGWLAGQWALIALAPVLGLWVIGYAVLWAGRGIAEV
jgi:hypothetical protein